MNEFIDTLNRLATHVSQTDVVALGAALAVTIQAFLNKLSLFKSVSDHVQDIKRFILSVALPFVLAVGGSLATGENKLELAPALFLAGQVLYYGVKFLVGKAIEALSKPTETQPL